MTALCIYHGNCADGFGAAWVVRHYYRQENQPCEFHAGVYQNPPPDVTDKEVFIVDFSYKRAVMEEIISKAAVVSIIDHHKTAIEDLKGIKDCITTFDVNHSGAMLTWKYFFHNDEPPKLIEHIQDRDLWRFEIPGTRQIQAALFSYPYDFTVWDDLMLLPEKTDELLAEGVAIERKHFKDINELLPATTRRMKIAGYNVPVANLPYIFSSDAGHIMAQNEPFAACYMDGPEGRTFSMRSNAPYGVDVSEVAKLYGGGGHKAAAGFRVSHEKAREFEI